MNKKVLISITTIGNKNWRQQIGQLKTHGIKELALFLSILEPNEREKCYKLIEKLGDVSIPFIHVRQDMPETEFDYLSSHFKSKLFNTHSQQEWPFLYDVGKYKKQILLENSGVLPSDDEMKEFGGLCLDISHLENDRLMHPEKYNLIVSYIEKFPLLATHVSAIQTKPHLNIRNEYTYESHFAESLDQLDYIKRYPQNYFGRYTAIELQNDIPFQLEAKKYIEKIIK